MWILLISVPLILFGLFCYGIMLFSMISVTGWIFNVQKAVRAGKPPNSLFAIIITMAIWGTVAMWLARYFMTSY